MLDSGNLLWTSPADNDVRLNGAEIAHDVMLVWLLKSSEGAWRDEACM